MSNQIILWSMLILPWLTLFFMKKEDIKRFITVGLVAVITSLIISDVGVTLNLWSLRENIFPLSHLFPYHLGIGPVLTMWLFKFTYGRFWRYLTVDAVLNLAYVFVFLPWLFVRGIRQNILATGISIFFITTIHGILLYFYQMWQEDALVPAIKKLFSPKLQPAAAKPIFEDVDNKDNRCN